MLHGLGVRYPAPAFGSKLRPAHLELLQHACAQRTRQSRPAEQDRQAYQVRDEGQARAATSCRRVGHVARAHAYRTREPDIRSAHLLRNVERQAGERAEVAVGAAARFEIAVMGMRPLLARRRRHRLDRAALVVQRHRHVTVRQGARPQLRCQTVSREQTDAAGTGSFPT
jgi:hypothetical protein